MDDRRFDNWTRTMAGLGSRRRLLGGLVGIGGAALYLLSDLSTGVTGDIHFVDSGYNIVSMPHPGALKTMDEAETAAEAEAAKDAAQ